MIIIFAAKKTQVRIARGVTARVYLRHLANVFVKDVAVAFPKGKLVAGKVLEVKDGRVQLSLKPSHVTGERAQPSLPTAGRGIAADLRRQDITEGMVLQGQWHTL